MNYSSDWSHIPLIVSSSFGTGQLIIYDHTNCFLEKDFAALKPNPLKTVFGKAHGQISTLSDQVSILHVIPYDDLIL